jgi:predicted transcriptional regulator
MNPPQKTELLSLTAKIVTAYTERNPVGAAELPGLITSVSHSLATPEDIQEPATPKPAVPIRRSATRAHIICLEDGTKHRLMKRHLRVAHQMTPDEYREKWGLPPNYPMTAASYSEFRRKLAKKMNLGKHLRSKRRSGSSAL